jgi:hypothetical protein
MRHPFQAILLSNQRSVFIGLTVLTLLMMILMNVIGAPLKTESAPSGIVSYELAGSLQKAQEIIASWDESARLHAAFSLGLDFLFLVVYSSAIGLGCLLAGQSLSRRDWPLVGLSVPLAWGLWLAALADAVENVALTLILFGSPVEFLAPLARWSAIIKFALIFAGLVYAFLGLVVSWVVKPAR